MRLVTAHRGPAPIQPTSAFNNPIVAMVPTSPIPGKTGVPPHLTMFYVNQVSPEEANAALSGIPIYTHTGAATPEINPNSGKPVTWLALDGWYAQLSNVLMEAIRNRYGFNVSQDKGLGNTTWTPHLTVAYGANQELLAQLQQQVSEVTMTGPYVFDLNAKQMPRQGEQRVATAAEAWVDIMLGTG